MAGRDKKIPDDLNEPRTIFDLKVAAAKRAEGNWAGCDDCDERYYPTQDDVKSLEAAIILIKHLDKQNTAMLALLERVVDIDNVFENNDPDKVVAWDKLTDDTKTLLKEGEGGVDGKS